MRMPAASKAATAACTLASPICMETPLPNMQAPPTILATSLPARHAAALQHRTHVADGRVGVLGRVRRAALRRAAARRG